MSPDRARLRSTLPCREPVAFLLLGATGDLSRRKILPALVALHRQGLLPERFVLLGAARQRLDDDAYRQQMAAALAELAPAAAAHWPRLAPQVHYQPLADDDPAEAAALARRLEALEAATGTEGNRLVYLAVPPQAFGPLVERLAAAGLLCRRLEPDERPWHRVVVEKPFGESLATARALNAQLRRHLSEHQIFRIDHFLGKETVQNLLVFRFVNALWEPLWSRLYLDHVQITVAETLGVEHRAGYYDRAGAVRDMIQNHLLQLFALVAMEPPVSYDAASLHHEKAKALRAVRPLGPAAAVRGQYTAGRIDGRPVPGYRQEDGVAPDSRTETFVAVRLEVDTWRWAGVPVFLRTGKRMARDVSAIVLEFRPSPHPPADPAEGDRPARNRLILRLRPDPGIELSFEAKVPGLEARLRPVALEFSYREAFGAAGPEAYERLLLEAMLGDASLFAHADEVEAAWAIVDPLLAAWAADAGEPLPYAAGSWGPAAAAQLLGPGRAWWPEGLGA